MFDIAFTELLVIGIVALIVIGPERLPKLARTAGQWVGRMNRYVSQVKQDIDRDLRLEELRNMQKEMQDTAQKYEILASERVQEVEGAVQQETASISKVMQAMGATDEGVSLREWEKLRQPAEETPSGQPLPPEPAPALASGASTDGTVASEVPAPVETAAADTAPPVPDAAPTKPAAA